jgi:hypothetical protein
MSAPDPGHTVRARKDTSRSTTPFAICKIAEVLNQEIIGTDMSASQTFSEASAWFRVDDRQSVSYYLGNNPEQTSLVWKDQYRLVGQSTGF